MSPRLAASQAWGAQHQMMVAFIFSHVEELVAYTLWDEKGVSFLHLVIPVLLREVTEDMTGSAVEDLVCLLVTRVEAADLPREQVRKLRMSASPF